MLATATPAPLQPACLPAVMPTCSNEPQIAAAAETLAASTLQAYCFVCPSLPRCPSSSLCFCPWASPSSGALAATIFLQLAWRQGRKACSLTAQASRHCLLGKLSSRQRLAVYLLFRRVRRHYVRTSREVKRWEATTRSPVFASFSAVLKASCWSCRTMRGCRVDVGKQPSWTSALACSSGACAAALCSAFVAPPQSTPSNQSARPPP